jgi:hypothetical protein
MKKMEKLDALNYINEVLQQHKEDSAYFIWDEAAVYYGQEGGFDLEAAKEHGLNIYKMEKTGGAMVTQPGDILCGCAGSLELARSFGRSLKMYLKYKLNQKGIKTVLDKNDLLIKGKKFMGETLTSIDGHTYFYGMHISYNVNLPLIQAICTKEMKKIPVGLSEFGISYEELEDWIKNFN